MSKQLTFTNNSFVNQTIYPPSENPVVLQPGGSHSTTNGGNYSVGTNDPKTAFVWGNFVGKQTVHITFCGAKPGAQAKFINVSKDIIVADKDGKVYQSMAPGTQFTTADPATYQVNTNDKALAGTAIVSAVFAATADITVSIAD